MANDLSPTAANIISSLGILGATVSETIPGYVPILGPNGKLSADFIPADAAQASIPHLSDAAFIDPHTSVESGLRSGSIVAPYKTIGEAAEKFVPSAYAKSEGFVAFILSPGTYEEFGNDEIDFNSRSDSWHPEKLFIIGLGVCKLQNPMSISGMSSRGGNEVVLQNLDFGQNDVSILNNPVVTCLGKTNIGGNLIIGQSATLKLSADAYASTDASTVEYLSKDRSVGNTSSVKDSTTVKDALDRLDSRKVRVARISGSGSGITAGSSYDVSAESSGGVDVYHLGDRDRALVSAIRNLYSKFANIHAQTVTAVDIEATGTLTANTLSIDVLKLGGYNVEVDNYGYLVVSEIRPSGYDSGAWIMIDQAPGDGRMWIVGVYDGRMFVERYYGDDNDSSDSSSAGYPYTLVDKFDLLDGTTKYEVKIVGGQMTIEQVNT